MSYDHFENVRMQGEEAKPRKTRSEISTEARTHPPRPQQPIATLPFQGGHISPSPLGQGPVHQHLSPKRSEDFTRPWNLGKGRDLWWVAAACP